MLPKLLIAAGNYNITNSIKKAIESEGIHVKAAFSHRDTLYMLQQQRYNVIIVDAAMFDRHSHEFTLHALDRLKNPIPRIAVALDDASAQRSESSSMLTLRDLDRESIRKAVATIIGTNIPRRRAQTTNLLTHKRLDEINMLFKVSKSLTQILDLPDLLNRVVEAARELTGADEGMILLPEDVDGEEHLMLRAKVGIDEETARNFRVKMMDTIAGEVYQRGESMMDDGADGPVKVKTQHLANHVLYVPIKIKNRTLGVLGVNNTKKSEGFEPHLQDLLSNLASYAAIAMENARVHEESIQRTQELEKLVRASQVMSASLAVADTYANICQQMGLVLDVSQTEIYVWNAEENVLEKRAQYLAALWKPLKGPEITVSSAQNAALAKRQAVWHENHNSHVLTLPVATSDQHLPGVLRACYILKPQQLPDKATLRDASTTAMEILADLLHTAEDRNSKRQDILERMRAINQQLACDWCELHLVSEEESRLHKVAQVGHGVWMQPPFETRTLEDSPELEQVVREHIVLQEIEDDARIALPIIHRGKLLGVISVSNNNLRRVFIPREIDTARALAAQAATALENSRLLSDLERSYIDLQAAQEKLVQTARYSAMGELAAVVAHQINNPLTTIIVDAQLLLEFEKDPNNPRYKSLQAINSAGRRASGVARRLLSVVRPTEQDDIPEMIDALDSLHGVLELLGTHIQRRNIIIEQNLPPKDADIPPVMAVKGQLDDIWLNLLTNAHDAMADRPNSMLWVEANYNPENGLITVVIRDNGPGIPQENLRRVFEPFFTTKPAGEGTGLGLHIVRQVIESVKGTIDIQSEPEKGTRFTITLPTVAKIEPKKVTEGTEV